MSTYAHASDCFLVSEARFPEAAERLRLLCSTTDGFRLAEEDLRAGDLVRDDELIKEARDAAFSLTERDPALEGPEHKPFLPELRRQFRGKFFFGRVA